MNYFDEVSTRVSFISTPSLTNEQRGNITDPPLETVATFLSTAIRYTHTPSRSPSPVMSVNVESPFCDNCQRNQALVRYLLAEYLPDEDHADYAKYEASFDGYRAQQEERYPQVCKKCEARVNDQIRNAGYAAKADNFARMLGKSSEKKRIVPTTRQVWTLKLISLAKWTYILSFLVQVLWHILGYIMAPDQRFWDDENEEYVSTAHAFDADICAHQALYVREVDQCCVLDPLVTKVVTYALLADLITLWWNPKLKNKTNSITGRMRGLKSLWAIRIAVFILRAGTLFYWQYREVNHETFATFHNNHLCMLVAMLLSFVLTFKTVRITHLSASSFREKVATTNNSPQHARKASCHPVRPDATAFDTMAHVFTRGFEDALDAPACPPSPTLTHSSYTTHATDATTPFGKKSTRDIDDMDWTPTQRRFAAQQPTIHPSPWQKQQPSSQIPFHISSFRKQIIERLIKLALKPTLLRRPIIIILELWARK